MLRTVFDDVLEGTFNSDMIERTVAETLDDLVEQVGNASQLLDGDHNSPSFRRRLHRCALQRYSQRFIENGVLQTKFIGKTPLSNWSTKLVSFISIVKFYYLSCQRHAVINYGKRT